MQTFTVRLNEEVVISLAELVIADYCATQYGASMTILTGEDTPALDMFARQSIEQLRETLRTLLRDPLKVPFFRRKLSEYFERHPIADIRTVGWEWAQEQLIWES